MSRADEPTETENRGPTSAGSATRRAEAGVGMPDPDRAAGGVEVATHIGPEDAQAALGRGRAWQAKGDHARALAEFEEAVRLKPDDA